MRGDHLGEFEELTLLAARAVGEQAYAVPVQEYTERISGRNVSIGAVYAALDRLERKGFLRSSVGEPTREPGGKRKRFYASHGSAGRKSRATCGSCSSGVSAIAVRGTPRGAIAPTCSVSGGAGTARRKTSRCGWRSTFGMSGTTCGSPCGHGATAALNDLRELDRRARMDMILYRGRFSADPVSLPAVALTATNSTRR